MQRRLAVRARRDHARRQRPVRGRAGRAARSRPRHLSVRHLVVDDRRRRLRGPGHRPDADRLGPGDREGLRDARRRRSVPDRARRTRPATCLRKRGNEFGSITGRPRRCGWLDIPALRLAVRISGIEGLALTKLDVLAGLERVQDLHRLPAGRRRPLDEMPLDIDDLAAAEPIYEELDGWPAAGASDSPRRRPRRRPVSWPRVSELLGCPSGRPHGGRGARRPS